MNDWLEKHKNCQPVGDCLMVRHVSNFIKVSAAVTSHVLLLINQNWMDFLFNQLRDFLFKQKGFRTFRCNSKSADSRRLLMFLHNLAKC